MAWTHTLMRGAWRADVGRVAALGLALCVASACADPQPVVRGSVSDLGHAGRDAVAPADALVVFLHGFGSNGADFEDMAEALSERLPSAAFLYPNAPTAMDTGPSDRPAFTWFEFAGGEAEASREAARVWVSQLISDAQAILGVPDGRVVLVGFSQGGGVAVNAATCDADAVTAAVVMGGVVDTACDADPAHPVTLNILHMEGDPRVPLEWMARGTVFLEEAGHTPEPRVFVGDTHWLSPQGRRAAMDSVVAALGGEE